MTSSAQLEFMKAMGASPASFVRVEAAALIALAARMEGEMRAAVDGVLTLLLHAVAENRRVALTGMGKSGIIGRKIAATLRSTGTPAHFLHPAEALHGDLGMLTRGDVALALSYSGETEELLRLLPALKRMEIPVVALTGCPQSTLGCAAAYTLDVSVAEEACPLNLAPTASTTVMLALGDALALELARHRGFAPEHFADLHPGGRLGHELTRRLARVADLMHAGDALPQVTPGTLMPDVIYEMSRKKLGMTTVLHTDREGSLALAGIISDGDLRRLLERMGPHALERTAGEVMNRQPLTIAPGALASEALEQMEARKITSLVVVDRGQVRGVIHVHDLFQP